MCNLFWLNLLFTLYYSSLPVWNAYLMMNLKIVTLALRWQPRLNIHSSNFIIISILVFLVEFIVIFFFYLAVPLIVEHLA